MSDRRTRDALAVAAAAPEPLLERSDRLWWGPRGLTLDLRDGPPLIFGTSEDAVASGRPPLACWPSRAPPERPIWTSAITGRVAAGGLGPVPQETPDPDAQP